MIFIVQENVQNAKDILDVSLQGKYIRCDQVKPLYPDPYFKNENAFHACCIINKEYVEIPENIKIAKKLNNRRHFFKCIIIYMFKKIKV